MEQLEINKLYTKQLEIPSFWGLNEDYIKQTLSNGRQCGVLLEGVIAGMFEGCEVPTTQGAGADILMNGMKIQAKTARPEDKLITRGPNKGINRLDQRNQWVSKSSLWDQSRERHDATRYEGAYNDICNSYYADYDYFVIINIAKFDDFYFEFIVVDSQWLTDNSTDGRISWNELLKHTNG